MPKFIPNNYKKNMLIALNFEDQLQPGTFKELGEKHDKLKRMVQYQINLHQDNGPVDDDDAREKRTAQTIDTLNQVHDKIEKFLNLDLTPLPETKILFLRNSLLVRCWPCAG